MVCVEIRTAGGHSWTVTFRAQRYCPITILQHGPRTAILLDIKALVQTHSHQQGTVSHKTEIQKAYLWIQQYKTGSHYTNMYSMGAL